MDNAQTSFVIRKIINIAIRTSYCTLYFVVVINSSVSEAHLLYTKIPTLVSLIDGPPRLLILE